MPAPLDERALRAQRDSLLFALTNLSHACTGATQAMMEVFDHLLQETAASVDVPGQSAVSHTASDSGAVAAPPLPKDEVAKRDVKKRKPRKIRDPNEPKRPTPVYFMWQQTQRPSVVAELGVEATRQHIMDELKRRWDHDVSAAEKEKLHDQYAMKRTAYRADMEAYKSHHEGTPAPAHETPKAVEAEASDDSDSSDDDSLDASPTPEPAPKPTPAKQPAQKKQKQDAKTAAPSMDQTDVKAKRSKQATSTLAEPKASAKKSKASRSAPSSAPAPTTATEPTSTPVASAATQPSPAPQSEKKKRKVAAASSGEPANA